MEQVLVMLVGFSDTLLAGQYLSESHLAAMTMISYLLWMLTNLFSLVAIGATAMTARFVGARQTTAASNVVNQSFLLGALFALAFTVVGILGADRLVELLRLEGQPARLATEYLGYLMPLLPLMMLEAVGIACLRGAGDMVTGLVSMILVNAVNIAVGWSLLLGLGPLEPQGWKSLAIGTACGHAAGGLIPFVVLLRGRRGLRLRLGQLRPDPSLMRRILRIGIPGGLDVLSIVLCQLIFLSIVNQLSVDEVAAHGVAIRIESLAYLPGYAFQVAAATLAGQYLGARDYRNAGRIVLVACLTNGALLTGAGLALLLGAEQLVAVFVSSQQAQVLEIAPHLLRIVSLAMPALALLQVLTGALRGAGDTRWPLAVTWLGFVGVRIPLAWLLLLHWNWGIAGAWYAMVIDLLLRTALIAYRFLHGGWKRVEV